MGRNTEREIYENEYQPERRYDISDFNYKALPSLIAGGYIAGVSVLRWGIEHIEITSNDTMGIIAAAVVIGVQGYRAFTSNSNGDNEYSPSNSRQISPDAGKAARHFIEQNPLPQRREARQLPDVIARRSTKQPDVPAVNPEEAVQKLLSRFGDGKRK